MVAMVAIVHTKVVVPQKLLAITTVHTIVNNWSSA